ncbi:D-alanyl-D-alanine carboxypeptidase/D-alanyl-D-alanine endopeptidase [Gloeocapsopsis dulcis]|uniref:D-alanyl-D-alanine carboxypeptidase/D-alanyl-D-alanine-endopeptidase n=1 Tax=Gloeocapsopsis dulcis AAB1 = 1H9 TaxID=1433147 RepID=A0A6N8FST7_9CHRO|nr:D-alanyl-D-alanine carboxypeptidase/D-alanyl-D-alanine-endopeptidase [Gloeocapsopsis dulcis]MUL35385.1 D-alanyl-D-alanine carboxypeptidase/D-alanyl-D-alanine-endopeptidase [Gloeocapsopsis dulcis AAB1 = 1H9]WNN90415.1 D-alanyl-D-alanine carboxypeptidase/D-alanyl-D-alanine-endopeptidase [Gloeocapsopsis dulcis]
MKLKYISLLLLFFFAQGTKSAIAQNQPPVVQQSPQQLCPAQIETAIEQIINRPQFRRLRWGISIQTLASAQNLYSRDAQKYFVPASNVKLLTTAAALQRLGSQFQIRTSVYSSSDGLRIVGRGDPSVTDTQLQELVQQLSRRGIRQVNQLIAEDSHFRGAVVNPTWEWEDVQADYGAPVGNFVLNQNAVELKLLPQQIGQPLRVQWSDPTEAVWWRVENKTVTVPAGETTTSVSRDLKGAVLQMTGNLSVDAEPQSVRLAVVEPTEHFLRHFRRALANAGITTRQTSVVSYPSHENVQEVAAITSPPLAQLLIEANQNSNNLYAEALLRAIAQVSSDSIGNNGLEIVSNTLTTLGVDPNGYVLADGSGLSRHNLMSPETLVQMLRVMANSNVYRTSLPVAGISGTLKNRFQNTPAQGIVQAKTGTMSGIAALSGYLNTASYEPLIFSILVNQSNLSATEIRQAIDEIVVLLSRLRRC